MKGTDLSRAVLRRSTLVRVDIKEVTWAELFVGDCIVDKCSLSDARLHRTRFAEIVSSRTKILDAIGEDVVISRCKFVECEFATIQFGPSDVQASEIKNSVMRCCTFFGGPFNDNALVQSTLSRLELRSSDAKNLDFTGSMLIEVDLTWLNLPSAVLLDSAVINCLWPEQNGRITTTGCYKPSPHLVAQPVQDVKGVSPLLRREIADAQFLVTKLARASHAGARFALRAWGATSAYGQSLIRLTVWSCIAVAFNAVLLLSGRGQIFRFGSDHHLDFTLVAKPLDIVVRSFLGLGGEPMHLTIVDQTVLVVARVEGFVALGLWISIAAMKVSRLSSE